MRRLCLALGLLLVASAAEAHSHNAEASGRGGFLHMSFVKDYGYGFAVPVPCTAFSVVYSRPKYSGEHTDSNGTIDVDLRSRLFGVRHYWRHPRIPAERLGWCPEVKKHSETDTAETITVLGQPGWSPFIEVLGGITDRSETPRPPSTNGPVDSPRQFRDISGSINFGIDLKVHRFVHLRLQADSLIHGLRGKARISFGGSASLAVGFHPPY
jgi:hypothetical protein